MATVAGSHSLVCTGKRQHVAYDAIALPIKRNMWKGETGSTLDEVMLEASVRLSKRKGLQCPSINRSSQKDKYCLVTKAMSSAERHLNSLNSYLAKRHDDAKQPSSMRIESIDISDELKPDKCLRSLENYLEKVKGDVQSERYTNKDIQASTNTSGKKDQGSGRQKLVKNYVELKSENAESKGRYDDEVSELYLIGALASINIAVFLFEIATPVKSSNFDLFSLPMVYGAKINNLILTGEWWRLVTPMFLHSGIVHIAIGSWALFTFGLEVSLEYGSFTFLLIYVLGGISGNLISFLLTPEPTVGGTGPIFALIGAWLIYQIQNKGVIAKDAYDRMFQKAIITAALICALSSFGPIDDWAHFGAAFTGIAYGFVTCPTLQVKDTSADEGRQERITLVRRNADSCKSLMYFSLFLLLLSSLLLIIEPPLELI